MTHIQFYVGKHSDNLQARVILACKLAQKAYDQQMRVYIHCDDDTTAQTVDELLWRVSDTSFLPHTIMDEATTHNDSPILIGYNYEPEVHFDYLINLSSGLPDFFSRFLRMAEIIDQTPELLSAGRQRYQFYKQRGYQLDYYPL